MAARSSSYPTSGELRISAVVRQLGGIPIDVQLFAQRSRWLAGGWAARDLISTRMEKKRRIRDFADLFTYTL